MMELESSGIFHLGGKLNLSFFLGSVADLQSISAADDNESTASWEERAELFEEAEEEKLQQQQQLVEARPTQQPTIYQKLTKSNVDWCRYCGTTEGVNWRPGPWGKRTLCK